MMQIFTKRVCKQRPTRLDVSSAVFRWRMVVVVYRRLGQPIGPAFKGEAEKTVHKHC